MIVKESFRRGAALASEARQLPAPIYNRIRLLLSRSDTGCVFVPIRNLQYQAVIDAEEIIFVDGLGPRMVEVAWQGFRPQTRETLDDPVPYQLVTYGPRGVELVARLQGEFSAALALLQTKLKQRQPGGCAEVLSFDAR